jgi:hypothetical protein
MVAEASRASQNPDIVSRCDSNMCDAQIFLDSFLKESGNSHNKRDKFHAPQGYYAIRPADLPITLPPLRTSDGNDSGGAGTVWSWS